MDRGACDHARNRGRRLALNSLAKRRRAGGTAARFDRKEGSTATISPLMEKQALSHIRKESLDIYNRLRSIEEDIEFVRHVHEAYPALPLLPNLRCGAWYTDPSMSTDIPAYFKSTDGHYGNWSFVLRRANLHLLSCLAENHGLVLVDSTRAGKRIPDALSKTVPIWCAVINRALLLQYPASQQDAVIWDTTLYTPPGVVSSHEHNSIVSKLDVWARDLANSSFDLPKLACPLRPIWITPSMSTFPSFAVGNASSEASPARPAFIPVVCVSASKQVKEGVERRSGGFSYIQGSGDDHELWGMGLTPDHFWAHRHTLLSAKRGELLDIVKNLVNPSPKLSLLHFPVHSTNEKEKRGWSLPGASTSSPLTPTSQLGDHLKPKPRTSPTPISKIGGQIWVGSLDDDLSGLLEGGRDVAFIVLMEGEDEEGEGEVDRGREGREDRIQREESRPNHESVTSTSREILRPSTAPPPPSPPLLKFHLPRFKSQHQAYFLKIVLPRCGEFFQAHMDANGKQRDVFVLCPTGRDLSVGVALVGVCLCFGEDGLLFGCDDEVGGGVESYTRRPTMVALSDQATTSLAHHPITKSTVKTRLEWIIASRPLANPARSTLKRVNEFLVSPSRFGGRLVL